MLLPFLVLFTFHMVTQAYPHCDAERTQRGDGGTIKYPKRRYSVYSSNVDCEVEVKAPHGKVIHISFKTISIEKSPQCRNDALMVKSMEYNLLKPFCGTTVPSAQTFYRQAVKLHFHSNGRVNAGGFEISYKFIDAPGPRCNSEVLKHVIDEGGRSGSLSLGNLPSSGHVESCALVIKASDQVPVNGILLSISGLALGSEGQCNKNMALAVKAGTSSTEELLCGEKQQVTHFYIDNTLTITLRLVAESGIQPSLQISYQLLETDLNAAFAEISQLSICKEKDCTILTSGNSAV